LIKEMAQAPPLGGDAPFRVVIFNDAHNLSRAAQAGLRRTMEKYVAVLKIFFHADSLAPLIPPLRSRCMTIRVPRPTVEQVKAELERVQAKQGVEMNPHLSSMIAVEAKGDMRYSLMQLDAMVALNGGNHQALRNANTSLAKLPWKVIIEGIVRDMLAEQTTRQLKGIREKLYGLLAVHVPPSEIFYHLLLLLGDALADAPENWSRLAAWSAVGHLSWVEGFSRSSTLVMPTPTTHLSSARGSSPHEEPPGSPGSDESASESRSAYSGRLKADAQDFVPQSLSPGKSETGSVSGGASVVGSAAAAGGGKPGVSPSEGSSSFHPSVIEDGDEITWLNRMAWEHGVNTSHCDDEGP
ncbi:Subunit of heteropentameric Replication factor C (RF-C), partial [Perkinsus olseni]